MKHKLKCNLSKPKKNIFPQSSFPICSMYGIYANIWSILMVHVTIYSSTMDPMGFRLLCPCDARRLADRNGSKITDATKISLGP